MDTDHLTEPAAETAAPRYFSRETSLLAFIERVLRQTRRDAHPLLERVKFLAISALIVDEFLSIHFSDLLGRVESGDTALTPDGLSQTQQLRRVRDQLTDLLRRQLGIFTNALAPELAHAGIHFRRYLDLSDAQRDALRRWFLADVAPVCTPLAVDPSHPFPFISNLSLNLGVLLWEPHGGRSFARIKAPGVLPRLIAVPESDETAFVWLEEVMQHNLDAFFPGIEVQECFIFRVVRDADLELRDGSGMDLRATVQEGVRQRRFGESVCLELAAPLPAVIAQELMARLDVYPEDVHVIGGPLGLHDLLQIADLDRPELRDPPLVPRRPEPVQAGADLYAAIRQRDILLHHPYESFAPVLDFIRQAAADPHVLAIKQTLYRVGRTSPLVQALLEAVDQGKQVAVVVELQARGDEENNIEWAETLERAGAHISYGVIGLKTHAKLSLVVRREDGGLRRYVHVGTGNYAGAPYEDLSLFTCDPKIGGDVSAVFNALTGRSGQERFERLLVSPRSASSGLIERIEREIARHRLHGDGRLIFKTNALTDLEMVDALYRASQAGIPIDLIVRGMCCLCPGVPGLSETIRVISVVGRFLEHSRAYYFGNGGDAEIFIGSADLMERNLHRRVETLAPIRDRALVAALKRDLLDQYLADNVRAFVLRSDGSYAPVERNGAPAFDVQHLWATTPLSFIHPTPTEPIRLARGLSLTASLPALPGG